MKLSIQIVQIPGKDIEQILSRNIVLFPLISDKRFYAGVVAENTYLIIRQPCNFNFQCEKFEKS